MANSYVTYPGDGVQTDWTVPFPYLDQSHVKAYDDGSLVALTFVSAGVVRVSPAVATGHTVKIARKTPTAPLTSFSNNNNLIAENLNLANLQTLYVAQESEDVADTATETADTAKATADTALSTANTANTNATAAVTTANAASTKADSANDKADDAVATANEAKDTADAAAESASIHVAEDLPYDNTGSGLAAENVQEAIDLIAGASGIGALTSDAVDNVSSVDGEKVSDALETLDTAINTKAAAADLSTLSDTVTAQGTTLAAKADASDVTTALAAKADASAVSTSLAAKADKSLTISVGGIATGGGDLAANRAITVPKASQAEAEAGSDDTKAMTPVRVKDAILALAPAAGQPIPTSSTDFRVGSVVLAGMTTGSTTANGSTIAGSSLKLAAAPYGTGVGPYGAVLSGTWKNISGGAIQNGEDSGVVIVGYWVRTA